MVEIFPTNFKEIGPEGHELIDDIKAQAQKLYDMIGQLESVGTAGDDVIFAKNKIIEAVMWALRAISK